MMDHAPTKAAGRPNHRLARWLASATLIAIGLPVAAAAQQLPVPVAQVPDPAMQNLTIPDGADVHGMWSPVQPWPLVGIHASLLPNGKVATYGSPDGQGVQDGRTYDIWDPTTPLANGTHVTLGGITGVNSFCSSTAFLPNGSQMIIGGIFDAGNDKSSVVLDPVGSSISSLGQNVAYDRYYASTITLQDGRALIVGGSYPYQGVTNFVPEVYNGGTGWQSLLGASDQLVFSKDQGRFWYPRQWQGPTGQVFGISTEQMWWLDPTGNGAITHAGVLKSTETYARLPNDQLPNVGPTSTAVMYDVGRILQAGGNGSVNGDGTYSSSAATIVDINGTTPVLREAAPMILGRQWANSTVLPTGTVMVEGGSMWGDEAIWSDARPVELWDKTSNQWTLGAAAGVYRGYHSTALLLTNGTVLTSGGGVPGPVNNLNSQIYYPPYLFRKINGTLQLAPRPQFVSLDANKLTHGQSFRVEMANANPIASVAMVRTGEVTHSFDAGQRYVPVTFSQSGTILTVQAPASTAAAPPGYYHLVAVNAEGIPSPSVIVALGTSMAAPPTAPATLTGVVSTAANATLTAASAQVSGPSYQWVACSADGQTCTVPAGSTIRYGSDTRWSIRTNTASLACNTANFGDPTNGGAKTCQTLVSLNPTVTRVAATAPTPAPTPTPTPTPSTSGLIPVPTSGTWVSCGVENTTCTVSAGTVVRYGANGTYVAIKATGPIGCNNATFGDPLYGTVKSCDQLASSATAGGWSTIGSNGSRIAAGVDGTVDLVDRSGNLQSYNSQTGAWSALATNAVDVTAADAQHLGYADQWGHAMLRINGAWQQSAVDTKRLSWGADGTLAVIVTRDAGTLWVSNTGNNWRYLNFTAKSVAVINANSIYAVGMDNAIYRWSNGQWAQVGVDALEVTASSDGRIAAISRSTGLVSIKNADDNSTGWQPSTASPLSALSFGAAGQLYGVTATGNSVVVSK